MIKRELKLILNKKQEEQFKEQLFILSGVYNWAVRKIELDSKDRVFYSKFKFQNLLSGHCTKVGVNSHTIQAILLQAYSSWDRCFKKKGGKPKLKSVRNKLRSIPFPDPIKSKFVEKRYITLPTVGRLKYFKQNIPEGKIKQARIVKKASGWYVDLTIDTNHTFKVKETKEKVGIDTGFKHIAILSNGVKFENRREFVKSQKRLAQAQRGGNKKLAARLNERIASRRKDNNHKISRQIVENYGEIYVTDDNLIGQAKIFGKSVSDAGIYQLRQFLSYKSDNHGRIFKLVNSKNTTRICSSCGELSGPTGLKGLKVRVWECGCGSKHDRDINAACVILKLGSGCDLVNLELSKNRQQMVADKILVERNAEESIISGG